MIRLRILLTLLALTFLALPAGAGQRPLVVFANPGGQNDAFFQPMTDFLQAAANDLGYELMVYYGERNHVLIDDNVENIFKQDRLPDYIIGMNARESGKALLDKAEAAGIPIIFVNQSFLGKQRDEIGMPRERYKQWLFEFLPDDVHAGYLLGTTLIESARAKGLKDNNGKINILAISGHETSSASILREKGLRMAVKEHPDAVLLQVTHAGWKRDQARKQAKLSTTRYPEATVYWSASDLMALGIAEGLREEGLRPGTDVLTGGIDWATLAMDMVKNGDFTATIGGHFMDAGWGLVMLHDHINGIDVPASSRSKFSRLTSDNISPYLRFLSGGKWERVDFTRFSKHQNPELQKYDFTLDAVMKEHK